MYRSQAVDLAGEKISSPRHEEFIFSIVLNSNDAGLLSKVYGQVEPEDFSNITLAKLFSLAKDEFLINADGYTLTARVKDTFERQYAEDLDKILRFCGHLNIEKINYDQVDITINLLKKLTINRKVFIFMTDELNKMLERPKAEKEILEIAKGVESIVERYKVKTVKKLFDVEVELLKEKSETLGQKDHIETNMAGVDHYIKVRKGNLGIIAARPAMGKTAFALSLANCMAKRKKNILFLSLEMSQTEIAKRVISLRHKVKVDNLNFQNESDLDQYVASVAKDENLGIYLLDTPQCSPQTIRFNANQLNQELEKNGEKLDMVLVDYIQLMKSDKAHQHRYTEVSDISRELKLLARELDVPIIALSQLNRNLEQRPNKRPLMSDLRESGALEQDADFILFLYRDEVYNVDTPDQGIAEVIIGKNRAGRIGTIKMKFDNDNTNFFESEDDLAQYGIDIDDYKKSQKDISSTTFIDDDGNDLVF